MPEEQELNFDAKSQASTDKKEPHKELQLDGFVDERSSVCIATFIHGFASGWFFAVSESFKDALDIKQTQRVFNNCTETLWTQGKLFAFSKGDVLYDTPDAYSDQEWRFVVKRIRFCLQVKYAEPSKIVQTKAYRTVGPVPIIEDQSETPKKFPHLLRYARSRIDFGVVRFAVLTPSVTGKLVEKAVYEADQESFVNFLQTGFLRCKDGTKQDFTK